MENFSRILPIYRKEVMARSHQLEPGSLSDIDYSVLTFLNILDGEGSRRINREAVLSVFPGMSIQDSLKNLEKIGLIEYEDGPGGFVRGSLLVMAEFPSSCNLQIPEQCRKMHEMAARYYEELQKSDDAIELASRRLIHSFIGHDESGYLIGHRNKYESPVVVGDDRSDFLAQPKIITIKPAPTPSEREFLIALARTLTHFPAASLDRDVCMLEAARIWHKIMRDNPDEHIFEFIAVVDGLLMSVCWDEDYCQFGPAAENRYRNLLAFLDLVSEKIPEWAEYCRFPVYLQLAEVHRNSNSAEQNYWATKTFVEFSTFVCRYGHGYDSDYLAVLADTGGYFRRVTNLKGIWLTILGMEEIYRKSAAGDPEKHELIYAEILMRFSEMILETMKIESAIVIGNISDNTMYKQAMDLYPFQEEWSRESISLYKKLSTRDESLLPRYADALDLHAFGHGVRTSLQRVVPRNFWSSLVMCLGNGKLKREINSELREHGLAAKIYWSCAEKISCKPISSYKEYFTLLEKYLHSVYQMGWSHRVAMNWNEYEALLKKQITVARFIWKVEPFYPDLPFTGLLRDYPVNVRSLRQHYLDVKNINGVRLCDKELFGIEHPYEDIFGPEFKDPAMISQLNDKAIRNKGLSYQTGTGIFRKYEVKPNKNLIISHGKNNGSVRAVFPDRFQHTEHIVCGDVDISPLVRALHDYEMEYRD